jgi:hypothetical protein
VAQLANLKIEAAHARLSGRIVRSLDQLRSARSICLPLTLDIQSGAALKIQIDDRNQLLKNLRRVRSHLFRAPQQGYQTGLALAAPRPIA